MFILLFLTEAWPVIIGKRSRDGGLSQMWAGLIQLLWDFILFSYYQEPFKYNRAENNPSSRNSSWRDTVPGVFSSDYTFFGFPSEDIHLFIQPAQPSSYWITAYCSRSLTILEMITIEVTESLKSLNFHQSQSPAESFATAAVLLGFLCYCRLLKGLMCV